MSSPLRTATIVVLALWAVLTAVCLMAPRGHGLTARYVSDPGLEIDALDPQISSHQLFKRWRAAPPQVFSVHWGGYVHVARDGEYTFATHSDDPSRVYVDGRLVVDNPGQPRNTDREVDGEVATAEATGNMQLEAGPHSIVIQYFHDRGDPVFEWSWGHDGGAQEPVPSWALSPTSSNLAALVMPAALRVWWLTSAAALLLLAASWAARTTARGESGRVIWMAVRIAAFSALAWLYIVGATEHARVVNTSKARADQSGYLWDAQQVYANRLGRQPPKLIGERMRMPVYAGLLTTIYSPSLSDMAFFEEAKLWNIKLSLALLAIIGVAMAWHLPPLASTCLTLIVGFGYFVYRAGYTQPELLFYALFFVMFLAAWHLMRETRHLPSLAFGVTAGLFAGLAYVTKAVVPPFLVIFLVVFSGQEVLRLAQRRGEPSALGHLVWRLASAAAMGVVFLLVISPYILNNKRTFGRYFYNANTTYFIWYDDGAEARAAILPHSDEEGRIKLPAEQLPTMGDYLRTRSIGTIATRVFDGLIDTAVRSYSTFGFLKYVALYLAFAVWLAVRHRAQVRALLQQSPALAIFLALYAAVYLPAIAFFVPTSNTGAVRFLLAHIAPLLFSLAWLFTRPAFVRESRVFHLIVLVVIAADLTVFWWPRMMTTYAGF